MDRVVVVDENDTRIRLEDKAVCHVGQGILHRAFSVFVLDQEGRLLMQQRSEGKSLWPLHWSNTCCSHPLDGESYEEAGERRLRTEMGFVCTLRLVGKFRYQAIYKERGSENELCAVLVGEYHGQVHPNLQEVAAWRWVDMSKLKDDIAACPDAYTPWFRMEVEAFF